MAEDYKALARKAAEQEGIDPDLYERQINQESRFNPAALSPKGAKGLAQLLPGTAKELGVNIDDPWENLVGGARYMKRHLNTHGGDVALALASYNAGPGNVKKHGGVPPFKETQDYIAKITGTAPSVAGAGRWVIGTAAERVQPLVNAKAVQDAEWANVAPKGGSQFINELDTDKWQMQMREDTRPSLWEMFGGAASGVTSSRMWEGMKRNVFAEAYTPEDGFRPDTGIPAAQANPELFNDLLSTRSQREYDDTVKRYADEAVRTQTVFDRGTALGMTLSIGTEMTDMANIIPGVAIHKVMMAKNIVAAAAAQGSKGAYVGREIAANVLSGTAIEGLTQVLEKDFKPTDLMFAAAFDVGLGGALGAHSATAMARISAKNAAVKYEVEQYMRHTELATKNLGADATPDDIAAEVKRIADAEAAAPLAANTTMPVTNSRKFFEEPEEALAKVDEAPAKLDVPVQKDAGDVPAVSDKAASWGMYLNPEGMATRRAEFDVGGKYEKAINQLTNGGIKDVADLEAKLPGVIVTDKVPRDAAKAVKSVNHLMAQFLPDMRVVLHSVDLDAVHGRPTRGEVIQVSDKAAIIRLNDKNLSESQYIRTAVHEVGHLIMNKNLAKLDATTLAKLDASYQRLIAKTKGTFEDAQDARGMRFSLLNAEAEGSKAMRSPLGFDDYSRSRDEFGAEQFVKYMEEDWATVNKVEMPKDVVAVLKAAIIRALEFLRLVKRENIGVTDEYRELFDMLLEGPAPAPAVKAKAEAAPTTKAPLAQADRASNSVNAILADPYAAKIGANNLPMSTDYERAVIKESIALHKKADEWAKQFPRDAAWLARAQNMADNNVFNVASIGLIMLKSESNLMRMLAHELVEDASGVAVKKGATAAISRSLHEQIIYGNTINDLTGTYEGWAKLQPGYNPVDDVWGGKYRDKFNRLVMAEREARARGAETQPDHFVKAASDSLDAAYGRAASLQRENKTLGWASLPASSRGYTPHQMSAKVVYSLTNEQRSILQSALTDQYVSISGWDVSFSDNLAAKVVERMRDKAAAGYVHPTGATGSGSVDIIHDALASLGMSADEVRSAIDKFTRGAAKHTNKRIDLDLNREYPLADGGTFKLLDVMETDQITLLRSQTERVAGETALARHGIYGKPHLEIMRKALDLGPDGGKASLKDLEAYDQMCAEFLGQPFGTAMGKWLEGAVTANTLVKMGGAVWNQVGETINAVFHLGAARTLDGISSIGRLRGEILAKARGETIENSWLDSIEHVGGGEFGTAAYKVVLPYDNPNHNLPAYGKDSVPVVNRILRMGAHYQTILSGWRMIHSAQQRGVAEQIVKKIARYAREGKDDISLSQMGIDAELQAALRKDLDAVTGWDGSKEHGFDVTKISDPDVRERVIHAVHRGTLQIIQGTFIGERGKWVHDGWMRALSQFRTFPITSMEKQWGRQRNSRGVAGALGMTMGAMSMAAPIYMARTYAQSVGREDQEAYLEKMLTPAMIARATMNYVATTGMAGDLTDLLSSAAPDEFQYKPVTRTGQSEDFFGSYLLPSASLVDNAYKAVQNPSEFKNWANILPFRNLPYLLPAVNAMKD